MKKVAITLIITLMLAGCSTPNIQKEPDTSTVEPISTVENNEQVTKTQEPNIQTETQQPVSDTEQPTIDKNWFAGTIGDAKIHAKLEVLDDKVSGVYYYDQYKTNINLEGYINDFDDMKDFRTISLTEDTDKRGKIVGVLRTNDYIEGYWKSDNIIYPMYLIREGMDITPPKKLSEEINKFDGEWTG